MSIYAKISKRKYKASFIYGLVDPRDGEIRYVGQSVNPQSRHRDHVGRTNFRKRIPHKNASEKNLWMWHVWRDTGEKVGFCILEECPLNEVDQKEADWISRLGANGRYLTNGKYHYNSHIPGPLQRDYRKNYRRYQSEFLSTR